MAMTRGFEIVPLVVGLFGIGEMMINAEARISKIYEGKLGKMRPSLRELKKGILASLRGALVGFTPGLLPGLVVSLTPFLAYDIEKRISKHPEKFGTGIIEGVASPEAANNATAQAGFIPLMALGIPTSPSYAIMLACLMMYGLMPGPLLFTVNKQFAWTVIGSMYIGNVILLILNLPLVGLWARISTIPYKYLGPAILGICLVGAYSPRNTTFDVWVAIGFGVLGYFLRKNDWPIAPVILGFILGPMLERALRQSVSMGGALIFFHRPIPVAFFILAGIALVVSLKVLKRIPPEVLEDQSDA
jgi:putative tricarboxylic transport membrane protein